MSSRTCCPSLEHLDLRRLLYKLYMPSMGRSAVAFVALCGALCTLSSLLFLHGRTSKSAALAIAASDKTFLATSSATSIAASDKSAAVAAARAVPTPPAPAVVASSVGHAASSRRQQFSSCGKANNTVRPGMTMQIADPHDPSKIYGNIRLILRPEWSVPSVHFASGVAAKAAPSTVYRLEPGFLIQGRLDTRGMVPPNKDRTRAKKVMERGEVGWAGGSAGPDYFIYLGAGPAGWLGNPHDGTIFAEVADEESMAVANNVSLVPLGQTTAPGQMHLLRAPLKVSVSPWAMPPDALDVSQAVGMGSTQGSSSGPNPAWLPPPPGTRPLGILKTAAVSVDAAAAAAPPSCNVLPRTELHGGVVKWGADHLLEDAAACCAACQSTKRCNVWVYCGSKANCGTRHKQCWLKHADNVWADKTLLVGTNELWTAGTTQAAPADHPSGAGRRLPTAESAGLLSLVADVGSGGAPVVARLRLREDGAPRAAATLRALADAAGSGSNGAAVSGNSGCYAALLDGRPVPQSFGAETLPDGIGSDERWPRGAAMIRGVLWPPGSVGPPESVGNGSSASGGLSAVEPSPVGVLRGSVAWAVSGGDGPHFFIALADMPNLGVSLTVWGEVVAEDLAKLDVLAADAAAGKLLALPMALSVRR